MCLLQVIPGSQLQQRQAQTGPSIALVKSVSTAQQPSSQNVTSVNIPISSVLMQQQRAVGKAANQTTALQVRQVQPRKTGVARVASTLSVIHSYFFRLRTSLLQLIIAHTIFSAASSEKPDYFSSAPPNTDNTGHPERCQAADARTARRRGNADAAHKAASGCGSSFRFECATRQAAAWSSWRLSGCWRVGHAGDHYNFVRHGCSCQSTFCCCRHSDQVKPISSFYVSRFCQCFIE